MINVPSEFAYQTTVKFIKSFYISIIIYEYILRICKLKKSNVLFEKFLKICKVKLNLMKKKLYQLRANIVDCLVIC